MNARHKLLPAIAAALFLCVWALRGQDAAKPMVRSIEPQPAGPGLEITIRGSGFGATNGLVWIGSLAAPVTHWHDDVITAIVPSATSGPLWVYRRPETGAPESAQWSAPQPFSAPIPPPDYNGITVNDVKVYDDATLQQMLNTARAQLASMQLLDPAAIAARIGSLQGATLQQSAFGLNVGGPTIPGVQTTANTGNAVNTLSNGVSALQNTGNLVNTTGGTTSNQQSTGGSSPGTTTGLTTSNQLVVTGPSTSTTTTGNNQTVTTGPSTTTVTTLAAPSVPTAPAPVAAAFTPPSTYSPSSSNILNEQVELTYEITGLSLLLEGALSDRYVQVGQTQQLRRRATIGVPVTITPPADATDMVAEVILEVTTTRGEKLVAGPPPLLAILPRDKTYNVASITNKSVSLGGGIATQVISAGVSALWGHQTYFLVEDQDTVAVQLAPDPNRPTTTRFGWQIRPVLGQKTVQGGMRMLYAQLAFPILNDVKNFGTVHVVTQWRKLNRKKNTLEAAAVHTVPIPHEFSIPSFDQAPHLGTLRLEDNGDGTLTVQVESDGFAPGTFVRIGSAAILPGAPNALFDSTSIRFTASAALLATHGAQVVDRSGAASEIIDRLLRGTTDKCLTIGSASAKAQNASTALVTVSVNISSASNCAVGVDNSQLVALIGNRVFGYRDSPMQATSPNLTFLAPLDLVRGSPKVAVKRVFFGEPFRNEANITLEAPAAIDKALVVAQSDTDVKLVLTGSGLARIKAVVPDQGKVKFDNQTEIGAVVTIQRDDLKNVKQIVFVSPAGELLMVSAPDLSGGSPQLQPHAAIKAGAATSITVTGSGLADFDHVECHGQRLRAMLAKDSVVIELPAALVKAGTLDLIFFFKKADKITYTISVFDTKVDLPQQAPAAK